MIDAPDAPLGFAALPGPLRARIEAELAPGEQLLWASRPAPKRPRGPARSSAAQWVWMVAWVIFGLASGVGAVGLTGTRHEGLVGLLLFAALLSGVVAFFQMVRLVADLASEGPLRRRVDREFYALTDRRALVWTPAHRSSAVSVRQYFPGSIKVDQLQRLEYPDGSGDLLFSLDYRGNQGLFGVAEVRRVDELVRRVLVPTMPAPQLQSPFDQDDSEEPF